MRAPYCLNSGLAPTSPTQPGQAMLSTFQIFYLSNNQQDRHNFLASVLTVNNIVDKVGIHSNRRLSLGSGSVGWQDPN